MSFAGAGLPSYGASDSLLLDRTRSFKLRVEAAVSLSPKGLQGCSTLDSTTEAYCFNSCPPHLLRSLSGPWGDALSVFKA